MAGLNSKKVALSLGILFAAIHTLFVFFRAQLLQYWTQTHFVSMQYTVTPLTIGMFILGIITAFVGGYAAGWVYAEIYNRLK